MDNIACRFTKYKKEIKVLTIIFLVNRAAPRDELLPIYAGILIRIRDNRPQE